MATLGIPYDLPMSGDRWVYLVVPEDFTAADADRLCGIIRALGSPTDTTKVDGGSATGQATDGQARDSRG